MHYSITKQLATGEDDFTNLNQLIKQYQYIEHVLKNANQSQANHKRYTMWKEASNQIVLASAFSKNPATTAIYVALPANPSLNQTTMQTTHIVQPRAIAAAHSPSILSFCIPLLTDEEKEILKKFGRCFNYKHKSHMVPNCTNPLRPYLAVSALLQELTLLNDNVDGSEKE